MNSKNTSIIIISICTISLIAGVLLQKKEANQNESFESIKSISSYTPFKSERITVIKLEGVISDTGTNSIFKDGTSSSAVLEQIVKATKDPNVKAIVLRINSPGGTVAASQEIYQALMNARKKKPIVITMGDVAASGGYYIASAGDSIYANPGTLTGSIGVITSYLNFTDLFKKIGVEGVTIKSGLYKDIGNASRHLTEAERKILQELLNNSYNQFISDVAKGRKMEKSKVSSIAEGLIYTGEQAKKIGLVDTLGDYYKAVAHAQTLAKKRFPSLSKKYGEKDLPVEETWKSSSFIESLIGVSLRNIQPNAENKLLKTYSHSKFQPLWLLE